MVPQIRRDTGIMALGAVSENEIIGRQGRARNVLLWGSAAIAVLYGVTGVVAQTVPPDQASQAASQSEVREFDIPAQPLAGALGAFNRQSGIQITQAAGATAPNVTVGAVRGRMTPRRALAQLLSGTGVPYRFTSNRAAVIGAQQTVNGAPLADSPTVLDPIVLTRKTNRNDASGSGFQGTPDWVYETPSSVSVVSRQAIQNAPSRNARDLLDNVAGVLVNRSESQNPGMSINIRGLQDQNRVITMIDGARQNFQRNGHGASQRTYVDTAFIREIDVEKSGVSGVGGAGALGGSVNFRTLVADDLIAPGRDWGLEVNSTVGTNAFNFDGSVIGAVRLSDDFSILGGVSHKNIGAYEIGKNGDVTIPTEVADGDTLVFTGQESTNTFLKAEGNLTDDLGFSLSWLRNDSESSQGAAENTAAGGEDVQNVVNNTVTASFDWDPDSELIDLKARVWYNHVKNDEVRNRVYSEDWALPVDYRLATYGASIENTSRFETAAGPLSINYGLEWFQDDGEASTPYMVQDGVDYSLTYTGTNPAGRRDMVSGFTNVTLEHDDWLMMSAGLRYDYYHLRGSTSFYGSETTAPTCLQWLNIPGVGDICIAYSPGGTTYYPIETDIDHSGGAFLPNAMIAVKATDWLQPFVKYSRSYRPPTAMESLFSGAHPNTPPVQYAPNPYLEPESGNTYEIGANISLDGVFSGDDTLRVKAVAFYREIEDYISYGENVYRPETDRQYASFVNLNGTTRMKGVELEANYDAGQYYIGGSFTWLDADFPTSYSYNGQSFDAAPAALFVPPKTRFTLDAGARFLEEKLTLGTRVTYVGDSEPAYGQLAGNYKTDEYTLLDLYGSYKFNETATLRVAVNNVTDVAYVPALGYRSLPAPGRTATLSLNVKF